MRAPVGRACQLTDELNYESALAELWQKPHYGMLIHVHL